MPPCPHGDLRREASAFFRCGPGLKPKLIPFWVHVRAVCRLLGGRWHVDCGLLYASEGASLVPAWGGGYGSGGNHAGRSVMPERSIAASRQPEAARAYLASLSKSAATAAFQRQGVGLVVPL